MLSQGESLLRQYLEITVPDLERIYNYRPPWLLGLELDIYFPQAKVGVEFNGDQHYVPTEFGHPGKQIHRDCEKRRLCKKSGIVLITITAIDLEWTRLNPTRNVILDRAHELSNLPPRRRMPNDRSSKEFREWSSWHSKEVAKLRPLNKASKEYRKKLIKLYDSPTARLKNKGPGKKAYRKAWNSYKKKS